MTAAIRKTFAEKPAEFDPRKYLGPARDKLILQTADLAALRNSSSGIPIAAFKAPPYLLIVSNGAYKFTPEQCHIDPATGRMVPPPLAFEVLDAVSSSHSQTRV